MSLFFDIPPALDNLIYDKFIREQEVVEQVEIGTSKLQKKNELAKQDAKTDQTTKPISSRPRRNNQQSE